MSSLLAIPLLAFGSSLALHFLALRLFPRLGLLDYPERYGLRRPRLPYPTGIVAVVVFLFFYLILDPLPLEFRQRGVLIAVLLLAAVCFWDDRCKLPAWFRLFVQISIALIIFLTGTRIFSITNPLESLTGMPVIPLDTWVIISERFSNPSLMGALFTILWLGLTMNALNWFDGVRGQVSVISLIGFSTLAGLSISNRVNDPALAALSLALAAIAAAGLLFDFPPAKVVMGDTGSMFFGLMLGVLTIYAGGKVATGFLVLGVPLIDSGIVILRRLCKGVSPFRGNATDEHLHHRLLRAGFSERQMILLTAALGTSFGLAALFMDTFQKFLAAAALTGIMMLLSVYSGRVMRHSPSRG